MRRRLALIVFAVTAMVTVAFLVPLAAVVRVVAEDRAVSAADQEARSLAGVLAAVRGPADAAAVLEQLNAGSELRAAVFEADGTRSGAAVKATGGELSAARGGHAFTASSASTRRVFVPVRNADGTVTVAVVEVPDTLLRRGVLRSWTVLGVVGALLVLLGVALADRLARSTVASIEELGRVTERLQLGDLDARVHPNGPGEVVEVGRAVNELAERIGELLATEREAAADLSHRLRTPLTALQLEADGLRSTADRRRLGAAVQQLAEAVTEVIREAREPRRHQAAAAVTDLGVAVTARLAFWSVLADDQGREWSCSVPERAVPVAVAPSELTAAVDALVTNVFAHTPEATGFRVLVSEDVGEGPTLVVEDDGSGVLVRDAPARGRSATGSTGLGLDIVRRTAERSGGGLVITRSASGGARLEVRFGPSAP